MTLQKKRYWRMQNGYCLPYSGKMKEISVEIKKNEPKLGQEIIDNLRIGIHWSTEVTNIKCQTNDKSHRIAQS